MTLLPPTVSVSTERGTARHLRSGTEKPFHLVMRATNASCIVAAAKFPLEEKMFSQNLAVDTSREIATFRSPSSHEPVEAKLVEAAKGGQQGAFAALCEKHTQQLLRAAHRITKSREDAEDAVQDALIRAFIHLRDFDGRSTFSTWLTRIAINSALMILRKRRTLTEVTLDSSPEDTVGFVHEIADQAPNPEARYARHEQKRLLRQAVQKLRPSLRSAVEIRQLQEVSMQETADAMGISLAAAKARLFHAKAALRKSPILKMMRRRTGAPIRVLSAA
jgi:RNA polymerase sigma factor (sigma-70 family)